MQATDKKRFLTVLTGVADYYGKELSEGVIGLYWQGLQQHDLNAIERALWEHAQSPDSGQFMPKIADLTRILQGRTQDQAAIAWSKVDKAIRHVGTYSDVVFDDPIIHRVVADMGGWIWLGKQTDDEWPFIARRFEQAYRGYKMRGEIPEYQSVLIGEANAYNQKEGYRLAPPRLVGNPQMAERVRLNGCVGPAISITNAADVVVNLKQIGAA